MECRLRLGTEPDLGDKLVDHYGDLATNGRFRKCEFSRYLYWERGYTECLCDGPIEILIGADIAGKLMTRGFKLLASGPAAIETKLGWTVFGENCIPEISDNSTLLATSMLYNETLISDLWYLDALGILDLSEKKNKL
ncbi:hypothetical protein AVEN_146371-1 [Araneus ventricosus]|uniref:Peptidase aspartic putative domain-containing protein n=1 Tax=Araneus ventricosus TaxID=182803 RepID=A0A4Y2JE83_ARAVE|nr:hypothetical protein AVEN_146371-1 [Araneus ventricosus]